MTTLERVRTEIEKHTDGKNHCDEYLDGYNDGIKDALDIIEKYAEQEPCDKCKYFDGNSCQHYDYKVGYTQGYEDASKNFRQEPCDDAISRDMALEKMADYAASGYADSAEDFEEYSRIICLLPSVTQKPIECDDAVSREAVVDDFIEWREKLEYAVGEDYSGVHLLNVAIQKIWDMPSVRPQEPCEDAVSRKDVTEYVCREICTVKVNCKDSVDCSCKMLKKMNSKLPSVQPKPKTGHWIEQDGFDGDVYYDCSECGESFCLIAGTPTDNLYNYCPICGAKMVELQESEDKG